ncbi:Uroporphyrinogen-III synthase [Pseudoalteromonas luteoviolacea B = ATCC 29581]|nr:Uroporphyrinogen-III synthase [Pseudoalteromonas luteoviolacea B = ATCC 29581]
MKHLLITRPIGKGNELVCNLEAAGFKVSHTPVLTLSELQPSEQELAVLDEADLIIFISQDAVNALAKVRTTLPSNATYVAVGTSTAGALSQAFNTKAIVPANQDTEGMLALDALQNVESKRVVIVKGKGGRVDLAKQLKSRQALLSLLDVYERLPAEPISNNWLDHWQKAQIDGIVLTSVAAVDAVFNTKQTALLDWLKTCTFFVVSERIAAHLREQYQISDRVYVTFGAQDETVFKAILAARNACAEHRNEKDDSVQPEQAPLPTAPRQADSENTVTKKSEPPFANINSQATRSQEKNMQEPIKSVADKTENQQINSAPPRKAPISKVGVLALLVAFSSIGVSGTIVWYGEKQLAQLASALSASQSQNDTLKQQALAKFTQVEILETQLSTLQAELLAQQQSMLATQEQQLADALLQVKELATLPEKQFALSEARYLSHLLRFKAVVEHDWQSAQVILSRLDGLASYFPEPHVVSAAVAQDLATVLGQEKPPTEILYVTLTGFIQQARTLPLLSLKLPEAMPIESAQLSEDVSDWRANLKRSWQQFLNDFISIRKRESITTAPLLSDTEQRVLRTMLEAYLTQAQTAAAQQQTAIYVAALESAKQHIYAHYDVNSGAAKGLLLELDRLVQTPVASEPNIELVTPQLIEGTTL